MTNKMNVDLGNEFFSYDEAVDKVKKEVEQLLTKSPILIREYMAHLSLSQGKYIRAVSVLICAEDKENRIHRNAIKVAAAIEILHLATLVHDDVIDNADLRRGKETLQKKYGKKTAVICGDYLLSLALKNLADISNKKDYQEMEIPNYISRLCLGELNQHINNHNLNLTIYQYLKIISGKTAALFEASFFAGAIIGQCDEMDAKKYRQLGYYIGMIFQLTDDCIDFDTTLEEANKPVQSDYEQGVITLPLLHALKVNKDFKRRAEKTEVTRKEINNAVQKSEGLSFTKMIIGKYYKKAMRQLNLLDLTESKKNRLISVLDKASRMT